MKKIFLLAFIVSCSDTSLRSVKDDDAVVEAAPELPTPPSAIETYQRGLQAGELMEPRVSPDSLAALPEVDPDFRIAPELKTPPDLSSEVAWMPAPATSATIAALDTYVAQMEQLSAPERRALKAQLLADALR